MLEVAEALAEVLRHAKPLAADVDAAFAGGARPRAGRGGSRRCRFASLRQVAPRWLCRPRRGLRRAECGTSGRRRDRGRSRADASNRPRRMRSYLHWCAHARWGRRYRDAGGHAIARRSRCHQRFEGEAEPVGLRTWNRDAAGEVVLPAGTVINAARSECSRASARRMRASFPSRESASSPRGMNSLSRECRLPWPDPQLERTDAGGAGDSRWRHS